MSMISLVNFVLTSVNTGLTGVSMEITTRGLAVVILISGPSHDRRAGRHPLQYIRSTSWPWCRPSTHESRTNNWRAALCYWKFHNMPGQLSDQDVDQVHWISGTKRQFQSRLFSWNSFVSGRHLAGPDRPDTHDFWDWMTIQVPVLFLNFLCIRSTSPRAGRPVTLRI